MRHALIFPGQASQFVGMGAELLAMDAPSRELCARAEERLGLPLSRLCREGPLAELTETRHAQPAILLVSLACLDYLQRRGLEAAAVAGHSLGEYAALVAAGVLGPLDALELVALRGRLMFDSGLKQPGTMAAVMGLEAGQVEVCCQEAAQGEVVQLANLNCPDQIVISGDVAAVQRAMASCREAGAKKVIPLPVSGGFHSALMAPAAAELGVALARQDFADAAVPVIPNVTARPTRDGAELRQLLVEQLTSPVRWTESMLRLREMNDGELLELGPGQVLTGLARRIDRATKVTALGDVTAMEAWLAQVSSPKEAS